MRLGTITCSALLTLTFGAHATGAQPPTQSVNGAVFDQTGAVLPGAQVELRATTGTMVGSIAADDVGAFRFDRVAPGRYDLTVKFEGFRPTTVRVTVGNRAPPPLKVTLPLAAISQEVTVGNTTAEVRTDAA